MAFKRSVREFIYKLRNVDEPPAAVALWEEAAQASPELRVVLHLRDGPESPLPDWLKVKSFFGKAFIVGYFSGDRLYFIDSGLLKQAKETGRTRFPIDYSISFDTNFASYVDCFLSKGNLKENHHAVVSAIDHLLGGGLRCDYIYYLIENTKQVLPILEEHPRATSTPDGLWGLLDEDYKRNLASLVMFMSIDPKEYRRTSSAEPTITRDEAEEKAKDFAHNFHCGPHSGKVLGDIKKRCAISSAILARTVFLQHSSTRSAKNKLIDLLAFMHEEIGCFMEREAYIAYRYFLNREEAPFLDCLNIGYKPLAPGEVSYSQMWCTAAAV